MRDHGLHVVRCNVRPVLDRVPASHHGVVHTLQPHRMCRHQLALPVRLVHSSRQFLRRKRRDVVQNTVRFYAVAPVHIELDPVRAIADLLAHCLPHRLGPIHHLHPVRQIQPRHIPQERYAPAQRSVVPTLVYARDVFRGIHRIVDPHALHGSSVETCLSDLHRSKEHLRKRCGFGKDKRCCRQLRLGGPLGGSRVFTDVNATYQDRLRCGLAGMISAARNRGSIPILTMVDRNSYTPLSPSAGASGEQGRHPLVDATLRKRGSLVTAAEPQSPELPNQGCHPS